MTNTPNASNWLRCRLLVRSMQYNLTNLVLSIVDNVPQLFLELKYHKQTTNISIFIKFGWNLMNALEYYLTLIAHCLSASSNVQSQHVFIDMYGQFTQCLDLQGCPRNVQCMQTETREQLGIISNEMR